MAISARIPAALDTNKYIPEIFSKNVLMAVKNKFVAVPWTNHSYEKELLKGDTLYITQSAHSDATEVTIGTEGVMADPTTTAVTLTINQYWERNIPIDYMSRRQSQVDLMALAVEEASYSLNKKIDSTVCALFSALNTTGTVTGVFGTNGSAVTDNVLIACVENLDEADAPEENRAWIFDPSVKADLLKIDKFVRSDYFAADVVPTGGFRKDIYGAPLLVTNNLTTAGTGNYAVYMHKDAIAVVISENVGTVIEEQPLKHQAVINATALWGLTELRDTFGVPIYTRLA